MAATITEADIVIPAIAEDGSYRPIGKLRAHREGVLHLAVSVFVFSGPRLLIQRRATDKYHSPGLWANTCCTHPHWDEPLATSAARRLREELGFAVPLTPRRELEYRADVGGGLIEHERVTMFVGHADEKTLAIRPDPAEVAATRWVATADLRDDMAANPDAYTAWFRIYCARFPDLVF